MSRPSRGELVARVLATAWRAHPEPLDVTSDRLVELLPLLLAQSGLAGLAWWRLRHSGGLPPALQPLEDTRGRVALQAFLHRRDLLRAVACLRASGLEPILVKGWAIARLYPDPHLRPSSDVDLCVRSEDYRAARSALAHSPGLVLPVDLHRGFGTLDEEDEQVLFRRSTLVDCGGTPVRVLAPEDHLRVLCYHMLRHGASRPLWLCDVALAIEVRPPDFDWARCLRPEPANRQLGRMRDRARPPPAWRPDGQHAPLGAPRAGCRAALAPHRSTTVGNGAPPPHSLGGSPEALGTAARRDVGALAERRPGHRRAGAAVQRLAPASVSARRVRSRRGALCQGRHPVATLG